MKYLAVQSDHTLSFDVMEIPTPSDNQCLIKVHAFGVNRADLLQKAGKYPPPPGESSVLGLEVCGEIVDCGAQVNSKVENWQVGQRIFGLVGGGGYAEYAVINAEHMIALPKSFSFEMGAAAAEIYLTAYQSLFKIAKIQPEHKVLVHGGASGIGAAAIQLAKLIGCEVVTTAGNKDKVAFALGIGADVAINYQETDFVAWQKEHLPQGFDVILDIVAGDYVAKNIAVAAMDAKIVTLAMLGGRFSDKLDIAKMLMKRITLTASTLRNRSDSYKQLLIERFCEKFYQMLEKGDLVPIIDESIPWHQANQLHEKMSNNVNMGKLVLTIPQA